MYVNEDAPAGRRRQKSGPSPGAEKTYGLHEAQLANALVRRFP